MNHVLYIIPILLAVTIPSAFAQVETGTFKEYDIILNEDQSYSWISHPPYLEDYEGQFVPYRFIENSDILQIETDGGKLVFDKINGAVTIFNNEEILIKSDSYVVRQAQLNSNEWNTLDINNELVITTFEELDNGTIIVTFTKENFEGIYKIEYIVNAQNIKTTAYFTNNFYENSKFAFTQTLELPDPIISLNEFENIDLRNYVGQSFPREILEENKDLILEIKDMYYSSGIGFDNLHNVSILENNKIALDYANVLETQTPIGGTAELDPTFTQSTNNHIVGSSIHGSMSQSSTYIDYYSRGQSGFGYFSASSFDVSSLTTSGAVVTSVTYSGTSSTYSGGLTDSPISDCSLNALPNPPSTYTSYSTFISDIRSGTEYVSGAGFCTGTTYTDSFNSAGIAHVQNQIGSGSVYFGHDMPDQTSTNGGYRGINANAETLTINYVLPSNPDAITDLSSSYNSPNIDLTFSTPADNYSAITSYKVYRDTGSGYSLYDTISASVLTSYQDANPVMGVINYYKINAVNGIGEALDSNVASVQAGTPPDAPTGLTSTIQDADNSPLDVFLQWSSPTNIGTGTLTGFEIYRNGVLITTTGLVNSYTDTVTQGSHSHYVKAVSTHGTSGNSNTVNITTPDVPDAITDLSGNIISDTQINISWTAPNDGGSNIDLYKIYRDGSQIDTTTNTSYSLTGLTSNTAYAITVYVNNSMGDSLVSNTVNLTTYQTVSGSITVTPNTQGASTQLTFSASGVSGTPTPTFSTFTLKEGITVIASGITSPYTLALNDNSPHTYTVTSTDNTHWNTPTIQGSTTVTATYDPNWSNNISYNYTRASGVMDLTVNRDTQNLWDATCNYKTTAQVMADQSGIVSNFTNVWYINDSQNIADTDTVYVSCNEDGTTLFSFTSFGPNRLGGGIAQLDAVFGEWTGTPVALIFVLLVAGLFTGRSAPTGILLVLALIGVLGFIGMLTIDEAVWGFLLLAGVLGIFLGKRFL